MRLRTMVASLGTVLLAGLSFMAYRDWQERPQVVFRAPRVYDLTPGHPTPRFVLVLTVYNPGQAAVEIIGEAKLRLRTVNAGGVMSVAASRFGAGSDPNLRVGPGASAEFVSDLWQVSNLYRKGTFPDLRDKPDDMRFTLQFETDAGTFESGEWAGISTTDDVVELARELRVGIEL